MYGTKYADKDCGEEKGCSLHRRFLGRLEVHSQ
jgi:hypothetical protein